MCTHQRKIKNKYTGQELYVKCGHCPSCLQEKASYRVFRIKAQDSKDLECVMVGLTYRRHCVPYVSRDDAFKFSRGEIKSLSVYRDTHFRKVRQNASYDFDYKLIPGTKKLCDIDFINSCSFQGNKDLKGDSGKIGVTFYPDVQNFVARLRLNLKRNFNFHHEIKCFSCSEYGAGKVEGKGIYRPHFHLLFWLPKGYFEVFRSAVCQSWPYGDLQRWERSVERAYKAATYCASYVNCGSDFPQFLKQYFPPKHSYSKDFGCNKELFSLPTILEKFKRGHCTYFSQQTDKVGMPTVELPFPKYIIHRYFPLFKGYGRLSRSALLSVMSRIGRMEGDEFRNTARFLFEKPLVYDSDFLNKVSFPVYYNDDDIHKIGVRLRNAFYRFNDNVPVVDRVSFSDYCKLHYSVWTLYHSDVLRLHLQNEEVPLIEKYDNLGSYLELNKFNGSPLPCGFTREMIKETDPNRFSSVVRNSQKYEDSFHEHIKKRSVSNTILSLECEDF